MMVLTFKGFRSGRAYSFPVGYAEEPDGLLTFTRFSWWRNLREERPLSLRLRGREVQGTAVAVRDLAMVAECFAYYLKRNPHDGRYSGVRVGRDGRKDPGTLARAADSLAHDPEPVGRDTPALMGSRRSPEHGTSTLVRAWLSQGGSACFALTARPALSGVSRRGGRCSPERR